MAEFEVRDLMRDFMNKVFLDISLEFGEYCCFICRRCMEGCRWLMADVGAVGTAYLWGSIYIRPQHQ